jgi:isoamylase
MAHSSAGAALIAYVARLTAIRRDHPVLHSPVFLHGRGFPAPGVADIAWFDQDGGTISAEAWNDLDQRTLVLRRAMAGPEGRVSILTLLLNPTDECRHFRLPRPHAPARVLLDSASPEADERALDGSNLPVVAHSAVLLHADYEEETG